MIEKILKTIYYFTNRDYIPPLPRGYLATKYNRDTVTPEQWRVLRKIGARDPAGIRRALKQYNVQTLDELYDILKHYDPQRNVRNRLYNALGRFFGGKPYDPYQKDINRVFRARNSKQSAIINERIKRFKELI